jgi:hypothetical protein
MCFLHGFEGKVDMLISWFLLSHLFYSGNSGGPVLNESGQVVGVASSILTRANNIGYIVPSMVVRMFFEATRSTQHGGKCNAAMKSIQNPQGYCGVASLGIGKIQTLENKTLREHLGLTKLHFEGGVRVASVDPLGACWDEVTKTFHVQPGDVLLEINGIPIGEDGTVELPGRPEERIRFEVLVSSQLPTAPIDISLLRNGQVVKCTMLPKPRRFLLPQIDGFDAASPPLYLICGGFVFMVLTKPLLLAFQKKRRFCDLKSQLSYEPLSKESQQVVVLTTVLANSINVGYHNLSGLVLRSFNGVDIFSLQHLATLVQSSTGPLLEFRLLIDGRTPNELASTTDAAAGGGDQSERQDERNDGSTRSEHPNEILAVMDRAACLETDPAIRKAHLIASPCSPGIHFSWPS